MVIDMDALKQSHKDALAHLCGVLDQGCHNEFKEDEWNTIWNYDANAVRFLAKKGLVWIIDDNSRGKRVTFRFTDKAYELNKDIF